MDIKELVSFYVNDLAETLDVSFRIEGDEDDVIREDQIELTEIKVFGYNFSKKPILDYYDDDDVEDDFNFFDESEEIDDYQIISFLTEYYSIYSDKLPEETFF
jgi:hypothetical protein